MVRCADASLYTGIAKDVARRCQQHNAGTASRYTRSRRPLRTSLPFALLMLAAGTNAPTQLLRAGRQFGEDASGPTPLAVEVAWQPRVTFFRSAGRGPLPADPADGMSLTQYLGHADLPDDGGRTARVEVLPDHQVRVVMGSGREVPVESAAPAVEPLDDPFAGGR